MTTIKEKIGLNCCRLEMGKNFLTTKVLRPRSGHRVFWFATFSELDQNLSLFLTKPGILSTSNSMTLCFGLCCSTTFCLSYSFNITKAFIMDSLVIPSLKFMPIKVTGQIFTLHTDSWNLLMPSLPPPLQITLQTRGVTRSRHQTAHRNSIRFRISCLNLLCTTDHNNPSDYAGFTTLGLSLLANNMPLDKLVFSFCWLLSASHSPLDHFLVVVPYHNLLHLCSLSEAAVHFYTRINW